MFILRIFAILFFLLFWSESSASPLSKEATYYADSFEGSHTSNGDIFSQDGFTAAACDIPLGKNVYISSGNTGAIVRVNDRPNCSRYPNIIDLTKHSFALFAPLSTGRISVQVDTLDLLDPYIFQSLGVELTHATPSVYFAGDGMGFHGRVTNGKRSVILFLQNQSTKEEFSRLYRVNSDGSFSISMNLPLQNWEYSIVLAGGNSFKTEITGTIVLISHEVRIISQKLPTSSFHQSPRIDLDGTTPSISFGEWIYSQLTLTQDTKTFQTAWTRLVFDELSFFHPGKATIWVDGYQIGEDGPLDRTRVFPSILSGIIILDRTHEKTGQNLVNIRMNKQSSTLRFRIPLLPRLIAEYFITLPNGDVLKIPFASSSVGNDGYLIPNTSITFSFPTKDEWTYMIEIVKDDGTAYVNLPITRGMVWNIIQPYTKESIKNIRKNSDSIKKYAISRINSIRASLGRNLLLSDDFLSKIAQAKVDDMIARKYVWHRDPDNNLIRDFAKKWGMVYTGTIAENIAVGNVSDMVLQDGLEESGWHRHTMVAPAFIKVWFWYGISGDTVYVVQVFWDQ